MTSTDTAPPAVRGESLGTTAFSPPVPLSLDRMVGDGNGPVGPSQLRRLKEEVARLIRSDIHQAVELAEQTRLLATRCKDPVGMALAHHASALAMHFSGRYAEALEYYQQAETVYARLGDAIEAARIQRAMVDVLLLLGDYQKALEVAAKAREVFVDYNQPILLAQLETNVGNIYHRLDRYQEALTFYQRAGEIFATHGDEKALAFIYFNCANQYTCLDDFEQALALYQQAGQIFEKLGMTLAVTDVEYSIAWLHFRRSTFHESLRLFAKVRERARTLGDPSLEALCDLDLCEVYLQLNAFEDAVEMAQSAVEKFGALQRNYERIKGQMYLGIAHTHMNELTLAERQLQEARCGFQAEGNEVFAALANVYLSDVALRQRNWAAGIDLCAEARHIFRKNGLPAKAAHADLQLASLKLCAGEIEEARSLCQEAMARLGDTETPWVKYRGFHLLGNVMEQVGELTEAYECYRQSVQHLESLRSSIRLDEYKCTFQRDKLRVYEDLVQLCLRDGTAGKVDEALSYVESAKSQALLELLSSSREIRGKAPGETESQIHKEWKALREQLNWFYSRINECELRANGRPDRMLHRMRQEAHQRERFLMKLIRQMQVEDPEYTSLQTATRPNVMELRQSLAGDEVVVEYFVVNDQVTVFVVTTDEVRVIENVTTIGSIGPLLRRLRFYFDKFTLSGKYVNTHQKSIQSITDQSLRLLYAQLVQPIREHLDNRKLCIVPHGVLHYVPFHALHDGEGYLIDQHEISYSPSASILKLCRDKAEKKNRNGQALVMGILDDNMPFIPDELDMVKSLYPDARMFVGAEATLDQLKRNVTDCRLLHLASHGVFRRDNPMFSALKLSDCWLNFYDIFDLRLNADLVTLSACETGMNEVFPGDELFGLMRGFLYAGAPSLIVSLWVVHDRSTAQFMRWLYTGLRDGLTKRAAMRQAQLAVKGEFGHPYYWAPFILMGAPV